MTDRIPGAPGRCKAMVTGEDLQKMQSGEEFAITLRRDDAPIREGTPYNKANILPDELASALCPEVEDPAPKDAFAALQEGKADAGRRKSGSSITLNDAANAPLMGLRIFGHDRMDDNGEVHIVGDKGSVTVNVMGKNIADLRKVSAKDLNTASTSAVLTNSFGTTLSATSGDSITVTQSKWPNAENPKSYQNGYVVFGFYCHLVAGDVVTVSFDYEITENPLSVAKTDFALNWVNGYQSIAAVTENGRVYLTQHISSSTAPQADGWLYLDFRNCGTSGVISNFQVEYGKAATDYEPYKEPETITIPTPSGLVGGSGVYDEIDFAKGVLIQRVREQSETPLPADVLETYANLRTYASTTIITNDEDADMEVRYCTPNTAMLMLNNTVNQGKFLAIDSHGAVSMQTVAAFVERTENTDRWETRIWSDDFVEMHKKDNESITVGQNGLCQIVYDLPFPVDSNCIMQVTPCGNVSVVGCAVSDDISLALTLAGQAGTTVSAIHISVAGRLKLGDKI